jgi:hypothetical protein
MDVDGLPRVWTRHEERSGRFVIVEVHVDGGGSILDTHLLRRIPLGLADRFANAQGETIRRTMAKPGPRPTVELERGAKALTSPFGQGMPLTIPRPDTKDLGDPFYEAVAAAWRALSTSPHPAKVLATANDVPVTTVHRWIRETRRRGFLPRPMHGKG